MDGVQLVVVTGLSGAGRTTALRVLEDLGFYCVDNLPPRLAPGLLELLEGGNDKVPVGLGIDMRSGVFLEGAEAALSELTARGFPPLVLFLDASDEALVRRFSETRRPHRLASEGDVGNAIRLEREWLAPLRRHATHVIDTTHLSVHDLRRQLVQVVSGRADGIRMVTRVTSFGFKYGLPQDADLVFDLRYLPNPYFVAELRPQSGLDAAVRDYVLSMPEAAELLDDLTALLGKLLPRYASEGKSYLTIGIGCTGGRHRSVAMAEALAARLTHDPVVVSHRDVERAGK
ncbi:MAG: putative ATP-binding protein [Myxococcaceae bacterium]|nr:putative ATP-binding protein [Myxococcaceae bacterium]